MAPKTSSAAGDPKLGAASAHSNDERTLHFLAEAANAYAILAPALSRAMMVRCRSVAAAADIELHPSITKQLCEGCSQVYVPGSNCRVSFGPALTKRRKRKLRAAKKKKAGSDQEVRCRKKLRIEKPDGAEKSSKSSGKGSGKRELAPIPRQVIYRCCVCKRERCLKYMKSRDFAATAQASHAQRAADSAQARKAEARNAAAAAKRARAAAAARRASMDPTAKTAVDGIAPTHEEATAASEVLAPKGAGPAESKGTHAMRSTAPKGGKSGNLATAAAAKVSAAPVSTEVNEAAGKRRRRQGDVMQRALQGMSGSQSSGKSFSF